MAAVARAWRENAITEVARNSVFSRIEQDFLAFDVTEVRRALTERVRTLVLRHPLRGYDAIQLASALTWRDQSAAVDFWGADKRLIEAAVAEGLRATWVGDA
jgi:uncharacterized protein